MRKKEAIPILEKFHCWLLSSKNKVPPQSGIGNAIEYALKQWPFLIRYLDYDEVEIDNNWVEIKSDLLLLEDSTGYSLRMKKAVKLQHFFTV